MSAYRGESAVRASWALELGEVERAARQAWTDAWTSRTRLALGSVVLVGGLVFLLTLSPERALIGLVGLIAVNLVLAWATTRPVSLRERLGAAWEDRRHARIDVSEEALQFADRRSEETVSWELVVAWREDEAAFVVFTSAFEVRVVPKRALTVEQQTALRQLLTDRVTAAGERSLRAATTYLWVPRTLVAVAVSLLSGTLLEGLLRVF